MRTPRVLVVDDEPDTIRYVSANLRARGYDVVTAEDGRTALKQFSQSDVGLIILDIMMPGLDGFQVCQEIRRESDVPIIMLSARGNERDIVRALDLGADDYLTKPFGAEELLARVRATLRRVAPLNATVRPALVLGDLEIEFSARRVTVAGREVRLTPTEYTLLEYLAVHAGRVLGHEALLRAVWGQEYRDETGYVWAYIRRLRRKIEPNPSKPRYILTQPRVGYWLAVPPEGLGNHD